MRKRQTAATEASTMASRFFFCWIRATTSLMEGSRRVSVSREVPTLVRSVRWASRRPLASSACCSTRIPGA